MKTHSVFNHHWLILLVLHSELLFPFPHALCSLCSHILKVTLLDDILLSVSCVSVLLYGSITVKSSIADPSCVGCNYSLREAKL